MKTELAEKNQNAGYDEVMAALQEQADEFLSSK